MPRGIYDRSKMKSAKKDGAAKTTTPSTAKTGKTRRRRRTKAEMMAARAVEAAKSPTIKTGRKGMKRVGRPPKSESASSNLGAQDQFAIVRENIVALSQVRANRTSDTAAIDKELTSELELMGSLRLRYFGSTQEATTVEEVEPQNGSRTSTIPLPPQPPQVTPPQPSVV